MQIFKQLIAFILTLEAQAVLWRHKPKIIAVTGSVGKTTTKDAIYAAISPVVHVRKSTKSFNSEIGVPLTILGLDNVWRNPFLWLQNMLKGLMIIVGPSTYPDWLILEVGADKPGDIRSIAKWLKPDIVVMTGVPDVPVHVEFFASPEEVFEEKRSLVEYLKEDGTLILNGDDERLRTLKEGYADKVTLFGFNMACSIIGWQDEIAYDAAKKPIGMSFTAMKGDTSTRILVKDALGRPRIYGALAALSVATALDIDFVTAAKALEDWEPPQSRMRIIAGKNGSTIIDDSYNSSPAAAISALETLAHIQGAKRKIALMADMLELGKYSADAHRAVGEYAATSLDTLITIGFRARAMVSAAHDAGMSSSRLRSYEHDESQKAGEELAGELKSGDIVLVKGSQSLRMERAVEALMADPTQAATLLVRQEPEWKKK
jgi:UDP-N-acetylmuramyl pentapeptide synthase